MAFLGSLGKSLGIGGLTHGDIGKSLLNGAATVGGFLVGGPVGAGVGNAAAQKVQGASTGQALSGGLTAGALAYGAGQLPGLYDSASTALGNLTAGAAPTAATGAGASGDLLIDPSLQAGGQAAGSGLTTGLDANIGQIGQIAPLNTNLAEGVGGLTSGAGNLSGAASGAGSTGLTAGGAASTAGQTIGQKLLTGLENAPGKVLDSALANPLQTAVGATGLLNEGGDAKAIKAQQQALESQAAATNAQVQPLLSSLTTGQLPSGAQGIVDQQLQSEMAQIRSKYANLGLSGSTMESQEINSAQERSKSQVFTIAQQMAQTGLSALGQSSGINQQLLDSLLKQDENASSAIGNLGSALGGAQGARA